MIKQLLIIYIKKKINGVISIMNLAQKHVYLVCCKEFYPPLAHSKSNTEFVFWCVNIAT